MEKYFVTLTKEELNCLKDALSIVHIRLNCNAERAYTMKHPIMGDAYKKEAIKMEELLDKLNNLK